MRRYHALTALGYKLVRAKRLKNNPVSPIAYQHIQQRAYHSLEEVMNTMRQIDHSTYHLFFELISQTDLSFMEVRLLSIEDIQLDGLTSIHFFR